MWKCCGNSFSPCARSGNFSGQSETRRRECTPPTHVSSNRFLNRDRINCASGILPKRGVGGKRKVAEKRGSGPHSIHNFSTALWRPQMHANSFALAIKSTSKWKLTAISQLEFSTARISTSSSNFFALANFCRSYAPQLGCTGWDNRRRAETVTASRAGNWRVRWSGRGQWFRPRRFPHRSSAHRLRRRRIAKASRR